MSEKGPDLSGFSPQQIELVKGIAERMGDLETIDLVVGLAKQLHERRLNRGVGGAVVSKNPNWNSADAKLHGAQNSVKSVAKALEKLDKRIAGLYESRELLVKDLEMCQKRLEEVMEEVKNEVSQPT